MRPIETRPNAVGLDALVAVLDWVRAMKPTNGGATVNIAATTTTLLGVPTDLLPAVINIGFLRQGTSPYKGQMELTHNGATLVCTT